MFLLHTSEGSQPLLTGSAKSIQGESIPLNSYAGKVVLVVNVASRCGFTKQYSTLQQSYLKYQDQGFVVLGFPCNQFGKQEPGSDAEIVEFCSSRFSVTFPMFSKVEVNGPNAHPLYQKLTSKDLAIKNTGPVRWNFEKFLIGRDGKIIARYRSFTSPDGKKLSQAIEKALAK